MNQLVSASPKKLKMVKRAKPEEIIAKLCEVEGRLHQGETTDHAVRAIGVTE